MPLLAIRFLAELLGLVALGYWGATLPLTVPWRVAIAIGAPLALALVWALAIAPNADSPLPPRARELVGTGLLLVVGGLLAASGQTGLAMAYAGLVVVDQALLLALDVGGAGPASAGASSQRRP